MMDMRDQTLVCTSRKSLLSTCSCPPLIELAGNCPILIFFFLSFDSISLFLFSFHEVESNRQVPVVEYWCTVLLLIFHFLSLSPSLSLSHLENLLWNNDTKKLACCICNLMNGLFWCRFSSFVNCLPFNFLRQQAGVLNNHVHFFLGF